jgi:MFS transporter, DHA2 family, multidrug resistance protein
MSVMDASMMNVALPTISRDLAISSAASTWVVTAYQIGIVMFLLPMSALGERFGYHRVYLAGLSVFVLLSLGCALAGSLEMLAILRFVQGLGAAALMAVTSAQMRFIWPRELLGRGIGYNAVVNSCATAAGAPVAGLLLSHAAWPSLFLLNIPIGLISLVLIGRFGPRTPSATPLFDTVGAILNAVLFCALFLGASQVIHGDTSLWLLGYLLAGLLCGVLLFARAKTTPRPMIPFDLMRLRGMRSAYAASVCAFASLMCLLVALPFMLEDYLHLPVATVGLLFVPLTILIAASSPIAGRMSNKSWAGVMSALGLCLNGASIAVVAWLMPARPPLVVVAAGLALCGIGFGLFQSPNNHVMIRSAPIERAGAAAGMLATCRLVGQTAGALIATLALRLPQFGPQVGLYFAAGLATLAAGFALTRSSNHIL